jgi:hypothetical protein
MAKISTIMKHFAGEDGCVQDTIHLDGMCYAGDSKKKKQMKISISINSLIAQDNLRELDKWNLFILAVPRDKVEEFLKTHAEDE